MLVRPSARRTTALVYLTAVAAAFAGGCQDFRQKLVLWMTPEYEPPAVTAPATATADAASAPATAAAERNPPRVRLATVAGGLKQPTDVQFPPGQGRYAYVLEKAGTVRWVEVATGKIGGWLEVDVTTASEQGLLGLAFHPRYRTNGRFFLNRTIAEAGRDLSIVEEWHAPAPTAPTGPPPSPVRRVYAVEQPYANHNAGQLAFGPDGMLYVGWGDGGWRGDPDRNGQDPTTALGAMLRLDVDGAGDETPYRVPPDNPDWQVEGALPEVWAIGLRNPWRYSFAPDGRLVVADVGQDAWEEIDIVAKGGNYGWRIREGTHCYAPKEGCPEEGLTGPFHEYGRRLGRSITGGYVYTGDALPHLRGRYLFGDFVSGRIWAVDLPPVGNPEAARESDLIGRWPVLPSSFGRDPEGEVYVADFGGGSLLKLAPAGP